MIDKFFGEWKRWKGFKNIFDFKAQSKAKFMSFIKFLHYLTFFFFKLN